MSNWETSQFNPRNVPDRPLEPPSVRCNECDGFHDDPEDCPGDVSSSYDEYFEDEEREIMLRERHWHRPLEED